MATSPVIQHHKIARDATTNQSIDLDKYLNDDMISRGTEGDQGTLASGIQYYRTGPQHCHYGLVIIPDILGWRSGRVRHIADYFGAKNIAVVIPNMRETPGKGKAYSDSASIMDWHRSRIFDGTVKPTITEVVHYLKEHGVEKIALLGVDWGSWAVASLLASEMAHEFHCGVLVKPSIDLEDQRYGGSAVDLVSRIKRPVLFMPVMADPAYYTYLIRLLKYKSPTSAVVDYHNMESGFLLHGLVFDSRVRRACHKMVEEIDGFIQQHFLKDVIDFVVTDADFELGPEADFKNIGNKNKSDEGALSKMKHFFDKTGEHLKESVGMKSKGNY